MLYKTLPAAFIIVVLSACGGGSGGSSSVLAPIGRAPLPANAAPPSYTLSALPLQARAINNNGVVVGSADGKAAKYANGMLTILPQIAGSEGSVAYDINDLGEAVGYDTTGVQQGASCVLTAYLAVYHRDGTATFSAGQPYPNAGLFGVNNSGMATGLFGPNAVSYPPITTVFSPTGGGPLAIGRAINNSGVIVGEYAVDPQDDRKPFVVPAQPNCCGTARFGSATDVNGLGHIVGYSYALPSASTAWFYASGTTTTLPDLAGATNSAPRAINDNDQVVGVEFIGSYGHGVLWENGQVYDLQSLVTNMPANARIEDAVDINNSGQIIVFIPSVGSQTFLLTPK
jgi:uncharacterized membrane protein